MAIRILEGVPGSGKSFYLVRFIRDNYYQQLVDGSWIPKDNITVVSNIDGLLLPHLELFDFSRERGFSSIDEFFEYSHQEKLTEELGGSVVYVIDEAQKFWRSGDKSKTQNLAFLYFEMHRHLGHDVFLATQDVAKLPKHITSLPEFIISAAPRSRSIAGEFRYHHKSDGQIVHTESLVKDKTVFELYKSMSHAETIKVRNPLIPKIIAITILSILGIGGGFYYFKSQWGGKTPGSTPASAKATGYSTNSKPAKEETATVVVSMLTETEMSLGFEKSTQYVIFQDVVYPKKLYPYSLRKAAGQWWSEVPASKIKKEQGNDDGAVRKSEVRRDGAEPPTSAPP